MSNLVPFVALGVSLFSLLVSTWNAYRGARNADRQLATSYGTAVTQWADRVLTALQDFLVVMDSKLDRQERLYKGKIAANKLINFHDVGGMLFLDVDEPALTALERLNVGNTKSLNTLLSRDLVISDLSFLMNFRSEFVTAVRASNGLRQLHRDVARYLK